MPGRTRASSSSTRTSRVRRTTSRGSARPWTRTPGRSWAARSSTRRSPRACGRRVEAWSGGGAGSACSSTARPHRICRRRRTRRTGSSGWGRTFPSRSSTASACRTRRASRWPGETSTSRCARSTPGSRSSSRRGRCSSTRWAPTTRASPARRARGNTPRGWLDPKHNLSLSAHAEIWKRHGPRLLWPLSLALRFGFLLLNFMRIRIKFPRERRRSGGDGGFSA